MTRVTPGPLNPRLILRDTNRIIRALPGEYVKVKDIVAVACASPLKYSELTRNPKHPGVTATPRAVAGRITALAKERGWVQFSRGVYRRERG